MPSKFSPPTCSTVSPNSGAKTAARFTMCAATIHHDGTTIPIHLVATSRRSALGYGHERLRLGTSLLLTVGSVELSARVGWSDGKRFRLDAELGDDGQLWALLAGANDEPVAGADRAA